ncbi:hypothetical protein Stsp01_39540 [Streptomyces sp. NBRC 13847]|nr:hypothetical protein Stsp01_39540 [Streptomyces sp. NBRC 13847]
MRDHTGLRERHECPDRRTVGGVRQDHEPSTQLRHPPAGHRPKSAPRGSTECLDTAAGPSPHAMEKETGPRTGRPGSPIGNYSWTSDLPDFRQKAYQ